MDPLFDEVENNSSGTMNPVTAASSSSFNSMAPSDVDDSANITFLASYGWFIVGGAAVTLYLLNKLRPTIDKWKQAREDAVYHKNPDLALSRMEAIQRAREKQQEALLAASARALEQQKEREERKRQEAVERLQKYGRDAGQRLGDRDDRDYMPLSAGASTSTYRPPKKSKCGGGGCGR